MFMQSGSFLLNLQFNPPPPVKWSSGIIIELIELITTNQIAVFYNSNGNWNW